MRRLTNDRSVCSHAAARVSGLSNMRADSREVVLHVRVCVYVCHVYVCITGDVYVCITGYSCEGLCVCVHHRLRAGLESLPAEHGTGVGGGRLSSLRRRLLGDGGNTCAPSGGDGCDGGVCGEGCEREEEQGWVRCGAHDALVVAPEEWVQRGEKESGRSVDGHTEGEGRGRDGEGGGHGRVLVGIVVCVRRRQHSLELLARGLADAFREYQDVMQYTIWAVEQAEDGRPFNRGALLNAGFLLAESAGAELFALQDVDYFPLPSHAPLYFRPLNGQPRHLLGRVDSAGGAVLFSREQYRQANGYPNGFWGWGFEDHDLLNRLETSGLGLDRRHWSAVPECGFTCFTGFHLLQDCSGTHGNRTGCDQPPPAAAAAAAAAAGHAQTKEKDQRRNKVRFLAARVPAVTVSSFHTEVSRVSLDELKTGDGLGGAGERGQGGLRFDTRDVPAEALGATDKSDGGSESWDHLAREHACGVDSVTFSIVSPARSCGHRCVQVTLMLGEHAWGEVT